MDYFYERNIVEIKNEYTTFLVNIITPFIYEGIKSVYSFALNAHNEFLERGKFDPEVKSPGVLKMFQLSLKEIPTLNNHSIELEANRIKSGSKCAEWFDDLVRAVIKSNIVLLTFHNPKKRPELLKEEYHNKIEIKDFLHKCYIESARLIYNNPELYWHEFTPLEIKRNQREACELIKQAIREAIRKMLPIKLILKEYLTNDYLDDDNDVTNRIANSDYLNIHSMVQRDLHGIPVPGRVPVPAKSILESSDDEDLMEGGGEEEDGIKNEEDYTQSSSSSSLSSSSSSKDYSQTGGNTPTPEADGQNELNKIKKALEEMETNASAKEEETPVPLEKVKETPVPPEKVEETPVPPTRAPGVLEGGNVNKKEEKPIPQNSIPKAEKDTEVQKLLKQTNMIGKIEPKEKKKLSKKELNLFNEIEANIKPKGEEPNRKLFFEQYMK